MRHQQVVPHSPVQGSYPSYGSSVDSSSKEPMETVVCAEQDDTTIQSVVADVGKVESSSDAAEDEMLSHKLVNLVGRNTNLLKVSVQLSNHVAQAIIDSGSVHSLVSHELVERLGLEIKPNENNLCALGGKVLKTVGQVTCSLSIHNVTMCNINLVVFNRNNFLNNDLYLGVDFLRENKLELCVRDRILIKRSDDEGRVEIHLDADGTAVRALYCDIPCYAAQDVDLDAGITKCVPINFCTIPCESEQMLLYSDDGVSSKIANKARGLTGVMNAGVKRVLFSCNDGPARIQKGQVVGKISSVVEIPDGNDSGNCANVEESLSEVELPELDTHQQTEVFNVLNQVRSVFSSGEFDLGLASVTEHVIKLSKDTPIYQRPWRFPPPIANEIERQCQELQALDIIEPSMSPWNSPIVPILRREEDLECALITDS